MIVTTRAIFDLVAKSGNKDAKEAIHKLVTNKTDTLAKLDTAKSGDVKNVLNTLLKELSNNTKTKQSVLQDMKQHDIPKLMRSTVSEFSALLDLIKGEKTLSKFTPILEKLLLHVKDIKPETLKQELAKSGVLLESKLSSSSTSVMPLSLKETLIALKNLLKQESKPLGVKSIEDILSASKADKGFASDIKALIVSLGQSRAVDKPMIQVIAQLETMIQKSSLIESKIQNSLQVALKDSIETAVQIKQILNTLLVLNPTKSPILEKKSQEIVKLVEQILKTSDFFPRELSRATISEKLQQIVNLIKSEFIKTDAKNSLHVEVAKLTNKLEFVMKEQIITKQLVPNQGLQVDTLIKQELSSDIKSVLLSIKQELSTQSTTVSREVSFQVDRVLTQIDYFQLMSLSSNSFSSYLPFLWEGLQEGQISLKKLKENRFFCEINLKLKEHGKIDLMLMLFEDIYLNISVFAEKKKFIALVRDNLPSLKQGINRLGLIPLTVELKTRELKDEICNHSLATKLNIKA